MGQSRLLKVFQPMDGLPNNETDIRFAFNSSLIQRVICCSLGPEGTNIVQASRKWIARIGISGKSEVHLGDTPEACLAEAKSIQDDDTVAIFWTCAVYSRESEFFFGNPDVFPFFIQEPMPLDDMQLATRLGIRHCIRNGDIPEDWRIASHPSPQHLVKCLGNEIILVNSNSAAAQHCAEEKSELCITTEAAKKIHGLTTLHRFGCPLMIFFGGITQHGAKIIKQALAGA